MNIKLLTELSLLAKQLCPEGRIEATTEGFEDEEVVPREIAVAMLTQYYNIAILYIRLR